MDVYFLYRGQKSLWDAEKASTNETKHGVRFVTACEVFFDPFVRYIEASVEEERRDASLGMTIDGPLLFVVHAWRDEDMIRIISARLATASERRSYEDSE